MITKEVKDMGLVEKFPVVILSDDSVQDSDQVILNRDDYSFFRMTEGMNDREIYNFAVEGLI